MADRNLDKEMPMTAYNIITGIDAKQYEYYKDKLLIYKEFEQ